MSLIETMTLFGIMAALAATPSSSVALVVTRSATLGLANGLAVTAGIVLGDLVFMALAVLGLFAVAEAMGSTFFVIKYLAAAYLLWLGYSLLRARHSPDTARQVTSTRRHLTASFVAGFMLTLGDIKAILFYASLLPVFLDTSALSLPSLLTIALVTVISVGGVKACYALSALQALAWAKRNKLEHASRNTAGGLMLGAAGYLIVKT